MCVESDRAHTAYANHLNLPFPILSDFNRQVVQEFGITYSPEAPYTGFWGMSKRSVFVLDREGTVRYAWVSDDPGIAPDIEPIVEAVRGIQHPT